jgi:dihydropteroate synthase
MAILNVTPDSFADGGRYLQPDRAAEAALELEAAGADLVDVGGESTRPGATPVSGSEELQRVLPVLERLSGRLRIPVSIDTYKADVAREALAAGAAIVNDVSGLRYDPGLAAVVADAGAALVLMHTRGRSREMYREAAYGDVAREVAGELASSIAGAEAAGVAADRIIVDPGLGFAKRAPHSYEALAWLGTLDGLGRPILVGPSRKSFLQDALGERAADDRDWGTAAAVTAAILFGAHIVRVHAVREMRDVARVADRIRAAAEAERRPGP